MNRKSREGPPALPAFGAQLPLFPLGQSSADLIGDADTERGKNWLCVAEALGAQDLADIGVE